MQDQKLTTVLSKVQSRIIILIVILPNTNTTDTPIIVLATTVLGAVSGTTTTTIAMIMDITLKNIHRAAMIFTITMSMTIVLKMGQQIFSALHCKNTSILLRISAPVNLILMCIRKCNTVHCNKYTTMTKISNAFLLALNQLHFQSFSVYPSLYTQSFSESN